MSNSLQIAENKLHFNTIDDLKALEEKLTHILQNLLDHDLNQLMSALYRIDISEQVFQKIVSKASPDQISTLLTKEIIIREAQKIETRKKYKDYFK